MFARARALDWLNAEHKFRVLVTIPIFVFHIRTVKGTYVMAPCSPSSEWVSDPRSPSCVGGGRANKEAKCLLRSGE